MKKPIHDGNTPAPWLEACQSAITGRPTRWGVPRHDQLWRVETGDVTGTHPGGSMRRLIVSTLVALDGVVEDPGGMAGSERGGWANPYFDEEAVERSIEHLRRCDYFLCGRRTYEMFSQAWPAATGPYAEALNEIPKLVASRTLDEPLTWNARLLKTDEPLAELETIKREDGRDIIMYGSVSLMSALFARGLVDQLDLLVCPVVVGSGQQLFGAHARSIRMELAAQTSLATGVAVLSYLMPA